MVSFEKKEEETATKFMINVNLVVINSKGLTPEKKAALVMPQSVHVLVRDADDAGIVLVDEIVGASEFASKSVGYKVQGRGVFHPAE